MDQVVFASSIQSKTSIIISVCSWLLYHIVKWQLANNYIHSYFQLPTATTWTAGSKSTAEPSPPQTRATLVKRGTRHASLTRTSKKLQATTPRQPERKAATTAETHILEAHCGVTSSIPGGRGTTATSLLSPATSPTAPVLRLCPTLTLKSPLPKRKLATSAWKDLLRRMAPAPSQPVLMERGLLLSWSVLMVGPD